MATHNKTKLIFHSTETRPEVGVPIVICENLPYDCSSRLIDGKFNGKNYIAYGEIVKEVLEWSYAENTDQLAEERKALTDKDKELNEILNQFPEYVEGENYVGTREYWKHIFEFETNRDPELHKAFSELHEKIINEVVAFCKEHNLNVDAVDISADGILSSREYGKWGPGTDSSMSLYTIEKAGKLTYTNREEPFLFEV